MIEKNHEKFVIANKKRAMLNEEFERNLLQISDLPIKIEKQPPAVITNELMS